MSIPTWICSHLLRLDVDGWQLHGTSPVGQAAPLRLALALNCRAGETKCAVHEVAFCKFAQFRGNMSLATS